jgi:hypothetical protein
MLIIVLINNNFGGHFMHSKLVLKITALTIATTLSSVLVATSTSQVKAASFSGNTIVLNSSVEAKVSNIESEQLYKQLSSDKKQEFNKLIESKIFNNQELLQILQDREERHPSSPLFESKWKASVIKAVAKLVASKVGEKSVADVTDFLFSWEGPLQDGIEYYLIHYGHFNSTVAHWTAKSIMFIVF